MAAAQVDERRVGELGEVDALGPRGRPGLAARERLELLDERRQAARVDLRAARARPVARFASRLVSGVRSSWPASAAKRRALSSACALPVGRGAEPREHRVEVAGERVDLLGPVADRHALGQVGRARDLLGGAAQALQRAERDARQRAREQRREQQRAGERGEHDELQPARVVLQRLEPRGDLERAAAGQASRVIVRQSSPPASTLFGVSPTARAAGSSRGPRCPG